MSYIYPFRCYITNLGAYNCGSLVGEWVDFPATDKELKAVFSRIGVLGYGNTIDTVDKKLKDMDLVCEEYFITDYDSESPSNFKPSRCFGEYTSIETLNKAAELIDSIPAYQQDVFDAVIESTNDPSDIDDLEEIIDSLDDYILYTDVHCGSDLAHMLIDEGVINVPYELESFINYDDLGESYGEDGTFTSLGYLQKC